MGLFSRNNQNDDDFIDPADLPNSSDLDTSFFSSESDRSEPSLTSMAKPSKTPSYGIEDAIRLMRTLPRESHEVVVTVVKKTLESTNIQVSTIIEDADQKEQNIRNRHKMLEQEIKELQEQIAKRNQTISELIADLKETTDVRQKLQLALEIENKSSKTATTPVKPTVPEPSQKLQPKNTSKSPPAAVRSSPEPRRDPPAKKENREPPYRPV